MTYSIIQKSQLEGAHRLDAEYYQPEYLKIRENIKNIGFLNFGDIITIFGSGKNIPQTDNDSFIKFVRTQNVRPIILDDNGMSFTQQKNYPELNYGDLLFVRVGEGVGNSSVVTKNFQGTTFSDNVIRIRIKNVNPFYISVLLNSKIGSLLMEQIKKGSARSLISRENLDSLRIPKITQKQQICFEEVVNQSEKLIMESKKYYSQAEKLLLKKLCLENFNPEKNLFSIANFSDCQKANRIDAEYFQPKFKQLIKKLKENKSKLLSDVIETVPAKFNPMSESERKFQYVELSNIDSSLGTISGSSEVLGREAASRAKRILKENDVIVSSIEGSLEKVALASKEQSGFLASTGFFQFRSKEILPEVLLVLAKSIVFQYQLKQRCAGTILTAVPQDSIKDILIPILPKEIQQKIAGFVRKSHEARQKSKELLEFAKNKVEVIIEKGKKYNDQSDQMSALQ